MPPLAIIPRIRYRPISVGMPCVASLPGSGTLPLPESSLGRPMVSALGSVGWSPVVIIQIPHFAMVRANPCFYDTMKVQFRPQKSYIKIA